jgi:hypothetical protein
MEEIIQLPSSGGYHFGNKPNLNLFKNSYFEETEISETNIINKVIILNIEHESDKLYSETDGNAGNCWIATMVDSRMEYDLSPVKKIYFRNFKDLVIYYKNQGLQFIDMRNENNLT